MHTVVICLPSKGSSSAEEVEALSNANIKDYIMNYIDEELSDLLGIVRSTLNRATDLGAEVLVPIIGPSGLHLS